jgi:hypothetical protein
MKHLNNFDQYINEGKQGLDPYDSFGGVEELASTLKFKKDTADNAVAEFGHFGFVNQNRPIMVENLKDLSQISDALDIIGEPLIKTFDLSDQTNLEDLLGSASVPGFYAVVNLGDLDRRTREKVEKKIHSFRIDAIVIMASLRQVSKEEIDMLIKFSKMGWAGGMGNNPHSFTFTY